MSKRTARRKETLGELARFALVGGLATVLHWLVYLGLLGIGHDAACRCLRAMLHTGAEQAEECYVYAAYTVAYLLSFLFNFLATSYITFHSRPTWTRLWGMAGAHAVNYMVHIVLLAAMLRLGVPERWAPVPVYCVAVPINFLLVRYVFKRTDTQPHNHKTA